MLPLVHMNAPYKEVPIKKYMPVSSKVTFAAHSFQERNRTQYGGASDGSRNCNGQAQVQRFQRLRIVAYESLTSLMPRLPDNEAKS